MRDLSKKKLIFLKILFMTFSVMIVVITTLFIIAMVYYPGGNWVNEDISPGYSLLYNGMCDMREAVAINGEPNPISSMLLKIGTIAICVAMLLFFGTIWIFFQDKSATKYLSWIASLLGALFGPFNIFIIFTHTTFELHMTFNIIAPLFLNLAILLYTIVFFIYKDFPRLNKYTFLILSIFAVSYSVMVGITSGIGGLVNMITHRLGSNLLYGITLIVFLVQAMNIFLNLTRSKQ